MKHVLVVTKTSDIGEGLDEIEYTLECPGVSDACRAWVVCGCPESEFSEELDGSPLDDDPAAHGVEHVYGEGEWNRPTDDCFYTGADYLPEAVQEMFRVARREPASGRYAVTFKYDAEGAFDMYLAEEGGN